MISRAEFYASFIFLILVIGMASYFNLYDPMAETEKTRLQTLDSIYQVQMDSAFSSALKNELRGDSLQAIINRRNLDITNIKKKYDNEKKKCICSRC